MNAINNGKYEAKNFGRLEKCNVLILERTGITLYDEENKNQKANAAWKWPWPTVCKIMTDVVKVKYE